MHAPKRPRLRGGALSSDAGLEIPPAQLSTRSVDVLHSLLPSCSFRCSYPGCTRVLRDLAGLKRHVTRIHGGGSASLVFDVSRGELDLADSGVSRTEQDQQQCTSPEQFASFDEDRVDQRAKQFRYRAGWIDWTHPAIVSGPCCNQRRLSTKSQKTKDPWT